jgi:lysophospholipase L1-like esterase
MNTNPEAVKVLCYGDSNTYARHRTAQVRQRYAPDVRWTGVVQNELGNGFYVIEEGLGGRTIALSEQMRSDRNGLQYLEPCLQSHDPDVFVVMLGTNDLKKEFGRSAAEIADSLKQYVPLLEKHAPQVRVIVVAPAIVDPTQPIFQEELVERFGNGAQKSVQLVHELKRVAAEIKAVFVDSNDYVVQGPDGIHWTKESHAKFGKALAIKIAEITELK